MRYICKKYFHDVFSGLTFKAGDVVNLSFSKNIALSRISDGKSCVVTTDALNENFVQYDSVQDSDDIRGLVCMLLCRKEYSNREYDRDAFVGDMTRLLEEYRSRFC